MRKYSTYVIRPTRWVLACSAAVAVLLGCGGSSEEGSKWQREQQEQSPKETPHESPSPPTLSPGKTISVVMRASDLFDAPQGSADVTLTSVKTATSVTGPDRGASTTADPGEQFVCLEFKIKNTGSTELDTYPFSDPDWIGEDGEAKNLGIKIGIECEDLGRQADSLVNAPDPQPGQFIRGTTALSVLNTQPGRLEFSDRAGIPLAYVNTHPAR
ncbi:hypothetical protein [Streptomyces sp. AC550_RSS872]|uniref:hypothetical protein n=1 Tax=Streptomyces sp. AC550_RSS872 TaxID=2823689 RepID=UPI001C269684|nr:hypothetical protein [Streptomyces sp. AC550_RSS872]